MMKFIILDIFPIISAILLGFSIGNIICDLKRNKIYPERLEIFKRK